jgi:hypothetical protein
MKRYLAFIGDNYYPEGGMDDFEGDFDSLEEAKIFIMYKVDSTKRYDTLKEQWAFTWANVWDTETREEVWSKH